jgi:hypothetical protein
MGAPDKNFLSYAGVQVGRVFYDDLIPPTNFPSWSDTLKFSNAFDGEFTAARIYGGDEDCVDFNNASRNLKVHADVWKSGGANVITIKGGCDGITVSGTIIKHGSVIDVDLDNYSDQNHSASKNIILDLATEDGSSITWRSLKGTHPKIVNPEQAYDCTMFLHWPIGQIWDRFYQLLKFVRICK